MSNNNGNDNTKRAPSTPHIPKGTIKGRAIDIKLALTDNESKEQLLVQFEITGEGDSKGKLISTRMFFTDATIEVTLKAMRAMGWGGVDPTDHKGMDKEVLLVIEYENETDKDGKQTGGQRSIVRWVNAIGVAVAKPLEGKRLNDFRSRVGAIAQKQSNANGAKTGTLPPVDGNDIPTGEPPPWMRG